MLDGAARVTELVAEVARLEMPAIAITDHGNVFGAFEFNKQAMKAREMGRRRRRRCLRWRGVYAHDNFGREQHWAIKSF